MEQRQQRLIFIFLANDAGIEPSLAIYTVVPPWRCREVSVRCIGFKSTSTAYRRAAAQFKPCRPVITFYGDLWPKSRRRLLVTRWESGEQPVVLLISAFDTWRVYGILKILRSAMCQMYRGERAGTLWWPKSRTHTSKLAQCMSDRGVTWFPAWCLTSRSSSPTYSCRTKLSRSDAGPPLYSHQRSQSCNPDRQMHRPLQHVHLPPGLLS